MAKRDGSIITFLLVHNSIGTASIDMLGNEEQRNRMVPKCLSLEKIACFALSEPDYGSDATSLETNAKKVEGGWLINGTKKWIGNSDIASYIVVWAKNIDD